MTKNSDLLNRFIEYRKDFPILDTKINSHSLIYLDNAATSQKPKIMVDKLNEYYFNYNSNIHRGIHSLANKATDEYEKVRDKVSKFLNCSRNEIIFGSGTTDLMNELVQMLEPILTQGDEILLSKSEHHANLVPWQQLAKRKKLKLIFVDLDKDFCIDINDLKSKLTKKTKIMSISHISNVLGSINPIKEISTILQENRTTFILDAAQSVPHMKIDVKDIDCDFLVFSAHKMCGPTGVGVLYGKQSYLESLDPVRFGGNMILDVNLNDSSFAKSPQKFETGTPNIANLIAFGATIDYITKIGLNNIYDHDKLLTLHFLKRIGEIKEFKLYGTEDIDKRIGLFSFTLGKVHPIDLAHFLDLRGIAIRVGSHCAIPLTKELGITSSARISFYFYNTIKEIDFVIDTLIEISNKYNK